VEEGELLVLADKRAASAAAKEIFAAATEVALPAWIETSAVQEISAAAALSPSGLEVAEPLPYAIASSRGARQRGVRIHRVLELLQAGADAAHIAKLVKHVAPEWNAKEQADAAANITALFTQENWLWAHERFAEVNVAGNVAHQGAQIPFSGQIDLLVKTPQEIIILDYKTGTHLPASAAEVPRNYLLQLKIYRALVRQIYPTLPVRCAILWTAAPSLMWLDEAVETTQFPDKNVMGKTTVAA
jgi:ATP-dependent helicase/nuclease subunit A